MMVFGLWEELDKETGHNSINEWHVHNCRVEHMFPLSLAIVAHHALAGGLLQNMSFFGGGVAKYDEI